MRLVLHMIANAHLDPVWLWRWPAAVDEILSTCRTACSLLDDYPELVFTRGEAWCHEQLRVHDPVLFRRVLRHAAKGRWQPVNGWWVQPDCNFPGADSFRRQADIGSRWFRDHLGIDVTVGYNVDSFGHCATLPLFLRDAGMDAYVFMRPGPHEKSLPAELFCWEAPTGDRVTACRIFDSYNDAGLERLQRKVERMIQASDTFPGHAMCFFGIGNHGGGPSRVEIEWIIRNARPVEGVELRFSHPRAYFDAVAVDEKPIVRGELQFHAVGCYSAVHEIKQEMRRTESLLAQADNLLKAGREPHDRRFRARLDIAWQRALFNQSHDLLGGSAVQSAYEHARDELGAAKAEARDVIVAVVQHRMRKIPACPRQRLVLTNPSRRAFHGLVELEPWLGYADWKSPFWISDESDALVPFQRIAPEAAVPGGLRVLLEARVPAQGAASLEVHVGEERPTAGGVEIHGQSLGNGIVSAQLGAEGIAELRRQGTLVSRDIQVAVFEDPSDAWSHDVRGFDGALAGVFEARGPWAVLEQGPLRAMFRNELHHDGASLSWCVSVHAGEPVMRMRLLLHWAGARQVIKLVFPFCGTMMRRIDGCPGGMIERPHDGFEYPVHDIQVREGAEFCVGVVSPDYYAADVQQDGTLRATLLRSPVFAHQDPFSIPAASPYPISSQGEHSYSAALMLTDGYDFDMLLDEAERQNRPPWFSECTTGMPPR